MLELEGCSLYRSHPLGSGAPESLFEQSSLNLGQRKVRGSRLPHDILCPVRLNLTDGLSPKEAAVLAVLNNAMLRSVRDAHDEASAQLMTAGLLPNPVLTVDAHRPVGSGSARTTTAFGVGVSMDMAKTIRLHAARAAARAHVEEVDLGVAWKEWQVAQAARLATTRLAMISRRLDLLSRQIQFETDTVQHLQIAMKRGDVTTIDVGLHRSFLASLVQHRGDLERLGNRTRARLKLVLGLSPKVRVHVTGATSNLGVWRLLPSADAMIRASVKTRLDLKALRQGYKAGQADLRKAVLTQFPSISVEISYQRDENALSFVGGAVSITLPVFDRSQGVILQARATRARLRHEYEARVASVRADVYRLRIQDGLLGRQIARARRAIKELIPLDRTEADAVRRGDVSRLAWQETHRTLFELRLKHATLIQNRLETRLALSTVVGCCLDRLDEPKHRAVRPPEASR